MAGAHNKHQQVALRMGSRPEIVLVTICKPTTAIKNNMTKRTHPSEEFHPLKRNKRFKEPETFHSLIRTIDILTPKGWVKAKALFDTGSPVFVLQSYWAKHHGLQWVERKEPKTFLSFNGSPAKGIGDCFAPFIILKIHQHKTTMACELSEELGPYEMIIPGEWFLSLHPMTFKEGRIQVIDHECEGNMEWSDDIEDNMDPEGVYIGNIHFPTELEEQGIKAMDPTIDTSNVPHAYQDFLPIFEKEAADQLPPHRSYDHAIDLVPGPTPKWGPMFNLSEKELGVLREYLDKMLEQGKIQPSKSPAGAGLMFVPKANGKLRLCVDYRKLNNITIRNSYSLPLMDELRDRVQGAKFFTKLDLRDGYYLIRIKEGDEWKTDFQTRYGHFEYKVMPFGLANALATFQNMINDILREYLDQGVLAYLDDILIYSKNMDDHVTLVKKVLQRLKENQLAVAAHKSIFHASEVEFLGYMVSQEGLRMSERKVESITTWETPKNIKDIQRFLGFANYYRRFIKNFSALCRPLTDSLKKTDKEFEWTELHQHSFDKLKKAFT